MILKDSPSDEQSDRQINKQTKQLIKTTYIKLSERDSLTPGAEYCQGFQNTVICS